MKTIFLCASMSCYRELVQVEKDLIARGFVVNIPVSAKVMKEKNDFDVTHFKGVFAPEEKGKFIRTNFENIAKGDAILVVNGEKNGIAGYIGANVLMEIGLAFYLRKEIYLWNPVARMAPYKEELLAFAAQEISQKLDKIKLD